MMQKLLTLFFVYLWLGFSFIMLLFMPLSSIGRGNKKPKEAKVKERQQIMRYLQQRYPNDRFKYAYDHVYPKFDPNKPYKTGLRYNTQQRESYGLNSQLLNDENSEFRSDFRVEVRWDSKWKKLTIVKDTYAQALLVRAFKRDMTKALQHPQELGGVSVEENLTQMVREKIKSYAEAEVAIKKEKESITYESRFYVDVNDYNQINDKTYQTAKLTEYIKAIKSINDCHHKILIKFFGIQGKGDTNPSRYQYIKVEWSSGDLDNLTNYADFVDEHVIKTP